MKWVKILKDNVVDGKAVGTAYEEQDGTADILVKSGSAEFCPAPEVAADAALNHPSLGEFVEKAVDRALTKHLRDDGGDPKTKSKRPGYGTGTVEVGEDNALSDPTFGFRHVGEQLIAIKNYSASHGQSCDKRLDWYVKAVNSGNMVIKAGPSSYSAEAIGADGGFLLAPQFNDKLMEFAFTDESLINRTDKYTTSSNNWVYPKDETTPWGSTGITAAWTGEAAQVTQTKPALGQGEVKLHKLSVLIPVSDEMITDTSAVSVGQYVTRKGGSKIRYKSDDAIINGTGGGMPLGIINAGPLVTESKESGQAAATINITNLAKMLARIPESSESRLVWLIHPSALPQLVVLTNGNSSLWLAPGSVNKDSAFAGTLLGIPLVKSQHCQGVGTAGDIYLFDMSQYITVTKGTGVETAMSVHLYFDYNVSTFRLNFRQGGQPWQTAAITSANGSFSMSPFVNLQTRS